MVTIYLRRRDVLGMFFDTKGAMRLRETAAGSLLRLREAEQSIVRRDRAWVIASFLAASLDTLVDNLHQGGKGRHKFGHSARIASARLNLVSNDIPDLLTTKITGGTFDVARIPALNVSHITSGTFASSFIPDLAASKITSGTLDAGRIPDLDATKITTGTFASADRIPLLPCTTAAPTPG